MGLFPIYSSYTYNNENSSADKATSLFMYLCLMKTIPPPTSYYSHFPFIFCSSPPPFFSFSCLTFFFLHLFSVLFFLPYFLLRPPFLRPIVFLFPVLLSSFPFFSSSYCFSFSCLTFFFFIFFFVLLFFVFLSYFLLFHRFLCLIEQHDSHTFSLKFSTIFNFLHPVIRNLNAFPYGFQWGKGVDFTLFYSLHQ